MSKSAKARVVEAALLSKGMQPANPSGDHYFYKMKIDGVTNVVTKMSRNHQDINDHLAGLMANQCYLQLGEFWRLIDCPLTHKQWVTLIKERCVNGRNPFIGR